MGYLAVKTLVDKLGNKPVEARTDTGAQVVDRDNLKDPAVREIVKPDLTPWLGK